MKFGGKSHTTQKKREFLPEPLYGGKIRFERYVRDFGHRQRMDSAERRILEFHVVCRDHKGFQVHHIRDIICQQGFQGFDVAGQLPAPCLPEPEQFEPGHSCQRIPCQHGKQDKNIHLRQRKDHQGKGQQHQGERII